MNKRYIATAPTPERAKELGINPDLKALHNRFLVWLFGVSAGISCCATGVHFRVVSSTNREIQIETNSFILCCTITDHWKQYGYTFVEKTIGRSNQVDLKDAFHAYGLGTISNG